jgi:hypothetical protein
MKRLPFATVATLLMTTPTFAESALTLIASAPNAHAEPFIMHAKSSI